MLKDTDKLCLAFIDGMKYLAKELGIKPNEITKAQFLELQGEVTDKALRKVGGWTVVKNRFFPDEVEDLDLKYGSKLINSHKSRLEKQYGESRFFEKELFNAVKESLKKNPILVHAPIKASGKKEAAKRTIVAAISDTHFGANISKEELSGLNEFTWTIAARRMALYMEQIADYKLAYRKDTDLVVQLNGDIIAGQIHNQEWFVDLLTTQFSGTIHLLSQALSYLAQKFPQVTVVCTPGNHGRNVGKADKGRATTHKWDSYENMIYVSLREILAQKHKNVKFIIPEAPFAVYKVQGHNIMQTHGDTVVNVGNPGHSLNMNSISNQINRVNNSDLIQAAEKIAVLSVGHVHVPTTQLMENGCAIVVNGCLSGTDPYAQSIGIYTSNPTQVIFECTKEHPVGDIRMIQVKTADKNAKYDSIIKPFSGKF
jgi:hypothetical protein